MSGWYGFRHALYQNVLYDRIAEMRRMRLHRLIGERLESGYGEQTTEVAAELAVHFEQGRDYRRAVQYREQVAQNALRRHAPQEALRHFTTARELLANLPATPARTRQELCVELALGGLLMTVKGYAALEVKQTYHRAHALGAAVGAPPQEIFHSLWGLFAFHLIRLELDAAYALGEQLCTLATEPAAATGAHVALGVVEHHRGNFVRACAHLARGRAVPPSCSAVPDLVRFGQDPWVTGLCYEAFSLALLGYLDQAQRCLQQARARAQALADPFTLAFCYEFMCFIAYWRRETHLVARQAEQLLALSTEHDFRMRTAAGHICRGWAFAVQQPSQETIIEVGKGIAAWQATGAALNQPFFLAFLGEVALRDQRRKEGSAVIAQALALAQRTGERFYEAELYRLKGELVLQQPGSGLEAGGGREKKAEAEACFWKALEVARLQQAKSLNCAPR